jgi:hypothetical protein
MKNIITAGLALMALSTAAYACPGHHHPCSPTECAPAKQSSNAVGDSKKVAQAGAAKPAQNDATVSTKEAATSQK